MLQLHGLFHSTPGPDGNYFCHSLSGPVEKGRAIDLKIIGRRINDSRINDFKISGSFIRKLSAIYY
jgi:hypothetical protein